MILTSIIGTRLIEYSTTKTDWNNKKNKLINDYPLTFFSSNNENYLIIGDYPDIYDSNFYINKQRIDVFTANLYYSECKYYLTINNNVRNDLMLTSTGILPVFYTLMIYYLIKDNYHRLKINRRIKKIIKNFSRLSLYIYLSHVLIMNIIVRILNNYWIYDRFYEKVFFTTLVFSLTSILSYLFSILFDLMYNKIEVILQKNKKNI